MKLCFLDVDGVCNDHSKIPGSVYCGIKRSCMVQLNRVVAETDCKIVLTSSWRYMILGEQMTIKGFEYMLATHGLITRENESLIIGCTRKDIQPHLCDRGQQVLDWLHEKMIDCKRAAWAVVDDMPELVQLGKHQWRFVATDGTVGLTVAEADRLIAILNGKESR